MANVFNVITKYLPKAVDKHFAASSKSAILEQGAKWIDVNFQEAGYVKIANVLLDGLADYKPTQHGVNGGADYAAYAGNTGSGYRDGFAIGNASIEWEIKQLEYKRGRQFRIDYIDDEETAGVVIANLTEEFDRLKVIPEVDETRFSKIASATSVSLGNRVSEVIGDNTIISKFNLAFEHMAELGVPEENQIIFVSPAVMTQIRSTTEVTKPLLQGDYQNGNNVTFTVEKYEGRPVVVVPSDRFFTDVTVGANGYSVSTGSKLINFMVVDASSVLPIRKLEYNKIYGPELSGLAGFHGYLINYLIYHGTIIPDNKVPGIYASVSSAAASGKVNKLYIDTEAGAATNVWVLKNYLTTPAGLRGYIAYATTDAFTLGGNISSVGTLGSDYYVISKGGSATNTEASLYFALVDDSGVIKAVSGAVTLVKGA